MMNNNKKRILWCGESSHIPSGFGGYTKEILTRLYQTGKYEIAELSCYRDNSIPKIEPWTVYPVAVNAKDPLYQQYISNDANPYGQWRFDYALMHFRPDIVIDIRDFWNFTFQDTSSFRRFYKWMVAPTYDSSPQKIETINMFKNMDRLLFHTDWAKKDLTENFTYSYNNVGSVVNDSVDSSIFRPIGYSKHFHKTKFGLDPNQFIIGSVMRNQKRKLIPELFIVLHNLLKMNKNIMLYLHTSYPDSMCWDIPSLLLEYQVQNNVLLTYVCKDCNKYYPSIWKGVTTTCKHCKKNNAIICSLKDPITQHDLNNIYNLFDIYIQYAICEGFGIPILEAASCGLPTITIDFGAMGDVGRKLNSKLVSVQKEFRESETNAIRCYPNNSECELYVKQYMDMNESDFTAMCKKSRSCATENFSWDKTAKIFETEIDNMDISSNIPWNCPLRKTNPAFPIDFKSNRQTIYDIIDNIICEPWLKNTTFIEELIKNTNEKFIINGLRVTPFTINNAIKLLELYMNNKNGLELIRTGQANFPDQMLAFLNYGVK